MKRRDVLRRTTVALGAGATAGCLSDRSGADGNRETTDDAGTTDATRTAPAEPTIKGTGTASWNTACRSSSDEESAEVTFLRDESRVRVQGSVVLPDPCHEAVLGDGWSVDDAYENGVLVVPVGAAEKEDAGACSQCTAITDYGISVDFEDGVPATVRVDHVTTGDRRTITTASR